MATTYTDYAIEPTLYVGNSAVSSVTIPLSSGPLMTKVWGQLDAAVDAQKYCISMVDSNGTALQSWARVSSSGTNSTYGSGNAPDNGYIIQINIYNAGASGSEKFHFNMIYSSELSTSSPYANPWLWMEMFYMDQNNTSRNGAVAVRSVTGTAPAGIKIFQQGGNLANYYISTMPLFAYD